VRRPEHRAQRLVAGRAGLRPLERDEPLLEHPHLVGEVADEGGADGGEERVHPRLSAPPT